MYPVVPLRRLFCSYRRMTLWLPHGLAQGVTADQIKKRTWFCRYENPYDWSSKCNPVPFELKLVNKGQMLMTVPDMWVRQHYWIKIYSSGGEHSALHGQLLQQQHAAWGYSCQGLSQEPLISQPSMLA